MLVHGAWVGEWCWEPVLERLAATGRPVHNVSLTGHGARRHAGGPHVTLADHVADVIGVVDTFDLTEVTLVGHSYGGRVITAALPYVADRLAAVVYVDAHAPCAPDAGVPEGWYASADAEGGMLPFTGYDDELAGLFGEAALAWIRARTTAHPLLTFTAPWQHPIPPGVRATYVAATGRPESRFADYALGAANDPAWRSLGLPGGHFLMFSHPDEVADAIVTA